MPPRLRGGFPACPQGAVHAAPKDTAEGEAASASERRKGKPGFPLRVDWVAPEGLLAEDVGIVMGHHPRAQGVAKGSYDLVGGRFKMIY